jgi:hypothetical protein
MVVVTRLRDRLERGPAMRAQRVGESLLLLAAFVLGDSRPATVAFALLLAQVLAPSFAPVALIWAMLDRRPHADRLGDLYYDPTGSRAAAAAACVALVMAAIVTELGWPTVGRVLVTLPAASSLLSASVGFCAGAAFYAFVRDLLVRPHITRDVPTGASDVDFRD